MAGVPLYRIWVNDKDDRMNEGVVIMRGVVIKIGVALYEEDPFWVSLHTLTSMK